MLANLTAATHRIIIMIMMIICASLLININTSLASEKPECPTTQIISCEKLHTAPGLTYTAPPMNLANDCEHGWYYLNGTCIVFSNGGTIPNLSLNSCENVQLQIDCPMPVFNCNIYFTDVKKSTTTESQANNTGEEDKQDGYNKDCSRNKGLSALKIVPIVIGILVALSTII